MEKGAGAEQHPPLPADDETDEAATGAVVPLSRGAGASAGQDKYFRTAHLVKNLGKRSVSAGGVAIAASGAGFVISIGTMAALGRLLSPEAFGLVGMLTAFTAFVSVLRDLGLGQATIQSDKASHASTSTLFWISTGAGVLCAAFVASLGPVLEQFYGQPELRGIALGMSMVFVLGGLSTQHVALLQRRFLHKKLAIIRVMAALVGSLAAVLAASLGAGYWALVLMPLVSGIYNLAGAWIAAGWRPGLPRRRSGVRAMLAFSMPLVLSQVLAVAMRNVDNIIIGRVTGAVELGFYVVAYRILMVPIRQINVPLATVALPTFSRLKDDPERFCRMYQKALAGVVLAGMPVVGVAFATSGAMLPLLLGDRWNESVPLFRALGPAALLATYNIAGGWAATSMGYTGRLLRWNLVGPPLTIVAFGIGAYWGGALGVAIAFSASQVLLRPIALWYLLRPTPAGLRDVNIATTPPTLATCLGAAAGLVVTDSIDDGTTLLRIAGFLGGAATFSAIFVGYLLIAPNARLHRNLVRQLVQHAVSHRTVRRLIGREAG